MVGRDVPIAPPTRNEDRPDPCEVKLTEGRIVLSDSNEELSYEKVFNCVCCVLRGKFAFCRNGNRGRHNVDIYAI